MKTIVTDCHACYLEKRSTPAAWSTSDGEFFCVPCRDAAGLAETDVVPIALYLEQKRLARQPEPKRRVCRGMQDLPAAQAPAVPKTEDTEAIEEDLMTKRTCKSCSGKLRVDSKFDTCTKCRTKKGTAPAGGERMQPRLEEGSTCRVNLDLNEEQMVKMFGLLPAQEKARALRRYFEGQ